MLTFELTQMTNIQQSICYVRKRTNLIETRCAQAENRANIKHLN